MDETSCDLEPIHLAGAVHAPAVMIVARDGIVEQVSENCESLLGRPPADLLGTSTTALPAPADELVGAASALAPGRIEIRRTGGWTYVAHHHLGYTIVEAEPDEGAVLPDELLVRLRYIVDDVDHASSIDEARAAACDAVRSLTGFDRVMAYEFHDDGHGEVVAESVADGVESFLGLHYPATDIPRQARRLYVTNPTRLIPDADEDEVPLLTGTDDRRIDLTHAQHRAVSPIHRQYLRNMGVSASCSLSLVVDGELVGLLAAHHREPRRLAYDTRSACDLVARILSEKLGTARGDEAELLRAEQLGAQFLLLRHLTMAGDAEGAVDSAADDLRQLVRADGMWCRLADRITRSGRVPDDDVVEALLDIAPDEAVFHTDDLRAQGDLRGGALISRIDRTDAICWFRSEQSTTITWAGDPSDGWDEHGKTLTPRASFERWTESIEGRSEPWNDSDRWVATMVAQGLLAHRRRRDEQPGDDFEFIVHGLSRYAAELELVNGNLESTNADLAEVAYLIAHDLRAPLRSIRSYLQLYREDLEDAAIEIPHEVQANWEVIDESATTMQSLLNALLEWARIRRVERLDEDVSLDEVMDSIVRSFRPKLDAIGGTLDYGTLGDVRGDGTMIRQLLVNLVDNAIKYRSPDRPIAITVSTVQQSSFTHLAVTDNGKGIAPRDHERVFRMFSRITTDAADGVGAGLAIVQRIVERHGGSITVTSSPGLGSTFTSTLPRRSGPGPDRASSNGGSRRV
ncbi:MAG: ATP-binding protein [Actinomycetota bacterium]